MATYITVAVTVELKGEEELKQQFYKDMDKKNLPDEFQDRLEEFFSTATDYAAEVLRRNFTESIVRWIHSENAYGSVINNAFSREDTSPPTVVS